MAPKILQLLLNAKRKVTATFAWRMLRTASMPAWYPVREFLHAIRYYLHWRSWMVIRSHKRSGMVGLTALAYGLFRLVQNLKEPTRQEIPVEVHRVYKWTSEFPFPGFPDDLELWGDWSNSQRKNSVVLDKWFRGEQAEHFFCGMIIQYQKEADDDKLAKNQKIVDLAKKKNLA
eukprot:TRINITY_DN748_c0_g1_i1.p1 TRINITY_DN748_c0_g1~~TRINITY_DN748_c0_g1_i1.p1  ORF type:complete len:174 (+),score=30.52 TRINITY_DN748_c0_g1_i1:141-662(+)